MYRLTIFIGSSVLRNTEHTVAPMQQAQPTLA
jgi:hypothetical protein